MVTFTGPTCPGSAALCETWPTHVHEKERLSQTIDSTRAIGAHDLIHELAAAAADADRLLRYLGHGIEIRWARAADATPATT
jgi:hypothetical protein